MRRVIFLLVVGCSLGGAAYVAQSLAAPGEDREEGGPPDRGPGGPPRGNALLELFDTNHDGELSAEEIANASAVLKKLDKNGDGKLSEDELPPPKDDRQPAPKKGRGRARVRRAAGGDSGPPDDGPGGDRGPAQGRAGRGGPGRGGRPNPERFVEHAMQFDADGDGKLDRQELFKFAKELPPPGRGMARRGGPGGRGPGGGGPGDDGPPGDGPPGGGPGKGGPDNEGSGRPQRPERPE
jgi:hypothetical protein